MTEIQGINPQFQAQKSGTQSPDQMKETAAQFEAFFLSQVLNSMSSGLATDKTFGGGESEKMFRSMLNDEYSKTMSQHNSIGIADAVYREMLKMQEVSNE
ncbi:rod-binding protein [Sneathiella sp.]|uniref:rod-binding protein n=1 Tax=Sneathiella sp. TaxID=1964365 RepID=UPI003562DCE7